MESRHQKSTETLKLLALFENEPARQRALQAFEDEQMSVEQLQVLPQPRSHPLFTKRIAQWGVLGAVLGVVLGGGMAWVVGGLLDLEHGLLVSGRGGEALTGAVMGALMVGTLGLLGGLATGESEGIHSVSEKSRAAGAPGEAPTPSETLLRVEIPVGREADTRRMLRDVGAASVEEESHSRWWDQAA